VMMDLTESIAPRSDQVNADDLIAGPITYTIREVINGKAESPFDFLLVETDRAYRPSKTMRRVIVNAWGAEASAYAGRRLTLYREPSIMFGGQRVGGIRISHMSHIDKPVEVMAQVTRGKREKFVVEPLRCVRSMAPSTSDTRCGRQWRTGWIQPELTSGRTARSTVPTAASNVTTTCGCRTFGAPSL
jgi:hypothetical protein